MKIIRQANELQAGGREVCIAIGMFDGVHLGHQKVLEQTISDAREVNGIAVAVTFDKHPSVVLSPERGPKLIYPVHQRITVIENLGLDAMWLIDFNEDFSKQPADLFVQRLRSDFGKVRSVCVGANFSFGYKRSGNVEVLQELGKEHGFEVHGLSAVTKDRKVISSTRIREKIAEGAFEEVKQLLGRGYSISGKVVKGDQLGRTLGFPTANVNIDGLVLPPFGVYAVNGIVEAKKFPGAANLGVRPTIRAQEPAPRLEVHFPGQNFDLYGKVIEIEFAQKLRGEIKFSSLEALKMQIEKDAAEAMRFHHL